MRVEALEITDFRNLAHVTLDPSPDLTVVYGQNGQGKTNLLEAIWMLNGGKSFRGAKDNEVIRRGCSTATLCGISHTETHDQRVRVQIADKTAERPGRSAWVDGLDSGRASSIAGVLDTVVFTPDHLALIKDGPAMRRRFMDTALCQVHGYYLPFLRRVAQTVAQKNMVLKRQDRSEEGNTLLDSYDDILAESMIHIMRARQRYMDRLAPAAADNYRELSNGAEQLTVTYRPCHEAEDAAGLRARLRAMREAERRAGYCLLGTHREDIEIRINGQPARVYASQGQQRSAVLAMKLAEGTVDEQLRGEHPIMLLDDVLSELDEGRQRYMLTRIQGKQCFITVCDPAAFARTDGKLIEVCGGTVREMMP